MSHAMPDDVVTAAISLVPRIHAAREEGEATRRVPPALAEALAAAGLFQMYRPRSMGGPELPPLTVFRAIEALSKADGSVGWCAMIATVFSAFAGWLPVEVGRALCGQPSDLRVAGSLRPQGQAVAGRGWLPGAGPLELRQRHYPCQLAPLLLCRDGGRHPPADPRRDAGDPGPVGAGRGGGH